MRWFLVLILTYFLLSTVDAATLIPRAFKADFIQQTEGRVSGKQEAIELNYQFPSRIKLKTVSDVTYICNEKKVWIYTAPFLDGEKGQLQVGESSKYCYSKIFDALQSGTKNNKLYTIEEKKLSTIIKFTKAASEQLQVSQAVFSYDKQKNIKNLKEILLVYNNGAPNLTLILKKLNSVEKFPENYFVFEAPKNTETIKMK